MARYRMVKLLGCGTFGAVYQAIDEQTGEMVAIKRAQKMGSMVSREIELLRMVSGHENCVAMLDAFYSFEMVQRCQLNGDGDLDGVHDEGDDDRDDGDDGECEDDAADEQRKSWSAQMLYQHQVSPASCDHEGPMLRSFETLRDTSHGTETEQEVEHLDHHTYDDEDDEAERYYATMNASSDRKRARRIVWQNIVMPYYEYSLSSLLQLCRAMPFEQALQITRQVPIRIEAN